MKEKRDKIRAWFLDYVSGFYGPDGEINVNINLKEKHSLEVADNMKELAEHLSLGRERSWTAEFIGLFHDLGRFEQLRRFKTFRDRDSVDHGLLGAELLEELDLVADFTPETGEAIKQAVIYHNKRTVPELKEQAALFSKMVRDADKLDILRVAVNHYIHGGNDTVTLHLPDTPKISTHVFEDFMKGRTINYEEMATIADFKVLQLGWIYDFNFDYVLQKARELGYIETLLDMLPPGEQTEQIRQKVVRFLEKA
jgi:putative nucleotidyltransferase with HDIG domain